MFIYGLVIWGMLLPMTGIMNWSGYNVTYNFIISDRYRMYFLMLLAISGSWLITKYYDKIIINILLIQYSYFLLYYVYW